MELIIVQVANNQGRLLGIIRKDMVDSLRSKAQRGVDPCQSSRMKCFEKNINFNYFGKKLDV